MTLVIVIDKLFARIGVITRDTFRKLVPLALLKVIKHSARTDARFLVIKIPVLMIEIIATAIFHQDLISIYWGHQE